MRRERRAPALSRAAAPAKRRGSAWLVLLLLAVIGAAGYQVLPAVREIWQRSRAIADAVLPPAALAVEPTLTAKSSPSSRGSQRENRRQPHPRQKPLRSNRRSHSGLRKPPSQQRELRAHQPIESGCYSASGCCAPVPQRPAEQPQRIRAQRSSVRSRRTRTPRACERRAVQAQPAAGHPGRRCMATAHFSHPCGVRHRGHKFRW